ncbi:hypothetical protein PMAYCL1PPCAC_06023 [Pristionchus mayeri]|uniref:Uncharacterized protein n=1 Tax=Pristionchus mayeri TaxID=1317129 RepID=A0AAN4Z7F1_9BILA|nr:hypothetical protein PMAYCL1PPCAC_06023 [Pristionchus mayeri]
MTMEEVDEVIDYYKWKNHRHQNPFSLPRELCIKIIEQECISIKDRMNLRLTCRALESFVAESDFFSTLSHSKYVPASLLIRQYETYDRSVTAYTWKTQIIGLLDGPAEMDASSVTSSHSAAYSHLVGRLFRRVFFDQVKLRDLTYAREVTEEGRLDVDLLLPGYLSCNSLSIRVKLNDYDPRMFDIITRLRPSSKLSLDIVWERTYNEISNVPPLTVDDNLLLTLPPLPSLRISAHPSALSISDATLLALVAKHNSVVLALGPLSIEKETFSKVTKTIADSDHYLELTMHIQLLIDCLRILGVGWSERRFISNDPSVKVVSSRHDSVNDVFDFTIKLCRTTITVLNLFVDNVNQNLIVKIGQANRLA